MRSRVRVSYLPELLYLMFLLVMSAAKGLDLMPALGRRSFEKLSSARSLSSALTLPG